MEENKEVVALEAQMGRLFLLREKCETQIRQANSSINEIISKIQKIKSETTTEE